MGNASESREGASFLRQAGGVRPLGMGSAFVAVADNAQAVYFNPAGLANCRRPEIDAMFSPQKFDQKLGSLESAVPLGSAGTLGTAFQYLRVTDIFLRQNEFDLASETSSTEWSVSIGYGKALGPVAL